MTDYYYNESPRRPRRRAKKRHTFLIAAVLIVIAAAFLVCDSNTRIVTTEYTVANEALPKSFDGFRIVQLSDLHGAEFGENNEKLFSAVKAANPDMIAITGDFIDEKTEDHVQYVSNVIRELSSIAPVYYVTGNHEWGSGTARDTFSVIDEIENAYYLRNRFVTIEKDGEAIVLAGIDDPNGLRDQKTLPEVRESIRSSGYDGYVLLLAHRNNLEHYDGQDLDLVLTGHGHGGIIRLPFTDGIISADREWFPENMSGLCETSDGGIMLVSRGLGNTPYTLRLFNNPEITVAILTTE